MSLCLPGCFPALSLSSGSPVGQLLVESQRDDKALSQPWPALAHSAASTAAAPESSTLCQGLTQGISNELKFLMQMNSSSQDTSTAAGSGKRARRSSGRRQGHAAGGEGSSVLQLHWKAPEFLHKRLIVVKVFPFSP